MGELRTTSWLFVEGVEEYRRIASSARQEQSIKVERLQFKFRGKLVAARALQYLQLLPLPRSFNFRLFSSAGRIRVFANRGQEIVGADQKMVNKLSFGYNTLLILV